MWVFYAMVVLAIMWPIVLMNIHLRGTMSLFEALANALLISLPFFFIPPRWRWSALVPVWLVALFFLTNMWYWRFIGNFMPITNYFLFNNVDSTVAGAVVSLMKVKDVVMVAPAAVITVCYFICFRRRIRHYPVSLKMQWLGTAVIVALFVANEIRVILHPTTIDFKNEAYYSSPFHKKVRLHYGKMHITPTGEYEASGLVVYFVKCLSFELSRMFRDKEISPGELKCVENFWGIHRSLSESECADSVCCGELDRNLIFIIVESLNSWAVEYEHDGRKLMPVLDSLVNAEGTLSSLDMVSQIHSGISSDGQFIYNTGMYPASDVTTVMYYTDNKVHPLSKMLGGRRSFEVICESEAMWKHSETTRMYGYEHLYGNVNLVADLNSIGMDEAMFNKALSVMDTIGRPFFAELTTMSMHSPYKDANVSVPDWIAGIEGLPEMMRNYMGVANYFDTQLGRFLEELKRRGLYDDSLIVIASDHESPVDKTVDEMEYGRIAFVALNAGVSRRIDHPVGQVDVFPTILDLMGVSDTVPYRGMGISMLNPRLDGAISRHGKIVGDSISPELEEMLRMSREASDVMLRCDWFGR